MVFRFLHKLGVPSDAFVAASLGSIAASIIAWAVRNEDDVPHAERLGIFIGLWAPTFMLIAQGIHTLEVQQGYQTELMGAASRRVEGIGRTAGQQAEAAVTN